MDVASLISGGKDSIYATYVSINHGWSIKYLVSLLPEKTNSWMFHSINIDIVPIIANSMGIPLITQNTKGEKESELEDLKRALEKLEIDGVISGAIASDYQRERICKVCDAIGIKCFSPIWHKNQADILRYQIKTGFNILIDSVSAYGLDKRWLGIILNEGNIEEFLDICEKYGINPSGEGGEYETIVLDSPLYREELLVEDAETIWRGDSGYYRIKRVMKKKKSVYDVIEFL